MTHNNALLVVNPAARHGETETLVPVIEQLLEGVLPHVTVRTEGPGHAREIAASAAEHDLVVAVGGDGTVHEVLNGLMSIPSEKRPALGLLPTGSGNDTRRTYGIPADLSQAVLTLASGERRSFDVGVCNGLFFNNSFAAGLDAKVTAKAIEYKVTKQRDGLWLYLTALLHVLFNDLSGFTALVGFDGEPSTTMETLILAVTVGPTYGGGFKITPHAVADDGLFEVCTIDPLSLLSALVRLPFVIAGKHTRMRPVHMSRHRSVIIEADRPVPAQIDGEVLLESRYEISLLPKAITCVVPRRP
ncbi:MAG: diacylglycerol kinase family lipid kinase [Anaerosomatales bacterium]|nr:diacylglycerol kinase family lipid kinase [Coriobacteriia bacterium]MDI6692817.1 diacylglycerol kinase family lipid kinase [Anaerosomatales bacterium]